MKILGTGLTGLVGSGITELLKDEFEFENLSRTTGVNIQDKESVLKRIKNSDAQIILHLAAKADVDGCEKDKALGVNGEAWKINVEGVRNVSEACLKTNKKIIYISTDFVFDGKKEFYLEEDMPNPINWYAQTKYEGEKIIQGLKIPWIIARIAYPYRANFPKMDFFRAILNKLKNREKVTAVTDHIFTPTYIDDIAFALKVLIDANSQGIFHVVGGQSLSPFEAANLIAKTFGLGKVEILKSARADFFNNRANRPFQLALKNDKITKLGVGMSTFEEGLNKILKQI